MPTVTVIYEVDGQRAWTVREVAIHLGVTTGRVLQLVRDAAITPVGAAPGPGGKKWLFLPAEVERLKTIRNQGSPVPSAPAQEE